MFTKLGSYERRSYPSGQSQESNQTQKEGKQGEIRHPEEYVSRIAHYLDPRNMSSVMRWHQ